MEKFQKSKMFFERNNAGFGEAAPAKSDNGHEPFDAGKEKRSEIK